MIRSRWFLAVSMVGFGSSLVCAMAAQMGGTPAQQPQTNQVPAFQATANLVLVDVVVRDKGKPVQGLRQSEFQVLEDGKPQTIRVFEVHKATDVQESAGTPVLPPHVYGNFPRYRITSAANVLLLDALNTSLNDQTNARAQMLKYLGAIPPGTQIAVFTLASHLRMISGFTTDVGTVEKALDLGHTPVQQSIMTDPSGDVAERQISEEMAAGIPEIMEEVNDFKGDREAFQQEQRMDITLGAFSELARYLSTVPGRKNLIWVSGGLSGALDPDPSRRSGTQAARFAPAIRTVNAELARARVAVYPVDARALMNLRDANPANVVAPTEHTDMGADLQAAHGEAVENDITVPQQWADSQQEMKLVATDTGGAAFYNTNAVGKAVEAAIADGENYYTLAYAPQGEENGAYRRIVVRLDEGKYDLQYRRGYYATDLRQAAKEAPLPSPMAAAMKPGVPPLSQVIFEARVLAAGDPELHGVQPTPGPAGKPAEPLTPPVTRYIVDYSIDAHELALKTLPNGGGQAELEVTQAVYTAGGKRLNSTDAGLEVRLPAAQMADDVPSRVRVRQEIDVPAGPVLLELGVRDATTGRIGTLEVGLNGRQ